MHIFFGSRYTLKEPTCETYLVCCFKVSLLSVSQGKQCSLLCCVIKKKIMKMYLDFSNSFRCLICCLQRITNSVGKLFDQFYYNDCTSERDISRDVSYHYGHHTRCLVSCNAVIVWCLSTLPMVYKRTLIVGHYLVENEWTNKIHLYQEHTCNGPSFLLTGEITHTSSTVLLCPEEKSRLPEIKPHWRIGAVLNDGPNLTKWVASSQSCFCVTRPNSSIFTTRINRKCQWIPSHFSV